MTKNIIQDVVANNRRSIRQISIEKGRYSSQRRSGKEIRGNESEEKKDKSTPIHSPLKNKVKRSDNPRKIIWVVAMLSVIFLLFIIASFFSRATIVTVPKVKNVSFDDSYTAGKNASSGELQFEVMTLRKKMSKQLEATETENSETKASGKIVVYNNFSTIPQRLIINTRFESEKGLIYKISESITIPGVKTVGGKKIPGSIETTVFADEPGDKYNTNVSDLKGDFKIPGFKGDKKYDFFYARIKTDITGGFKGLVNKVPEEILSEVRKELRENIKTELLKEVFATKPQSSVLYEGSYYIDYVSLPDISSGADKVEINEDAIFYGIIFDEAKFSSYVAKKKLSSGYDGAPVTLILDDNATVIISNDSKTNIWESDSLNISLKGKGDIVWTYDEFLLKKSLAGQKKNKLNDILSSYPGIVEISAEIRPYWKWSFPNNLEKIKIENSILGK